MANDHVELVASQIIEQLKTGTAPWVRPWKPGERFIPINATTGNPYRGMNAVWLLSLSMACGFNDPRWMTYRQAAGIGAQVRKGEKGSPIQIFKSHDQVAIRDESGKPVLNEDGTPQRRFIKLEHPVIRTAVVFNATQIDGLPNLEAQPRPEWDRHAEAEHVLVHSGAHILHLPGDRAVYSLTSDRITLPQQSQFPTMDGYYATALHELGHWTGHPSRLNRDMGHPFGTEAYAKEELRAEIASLMLGDQLGIGHDPGQHVAYIDSWIRVLENDPREIFRAAADAERIVTFVRGREHRQEIPQQPEETVPMTHTPATERVYLAVPYVEKSAAKALGARWDRSEKAWYVPVGGQIEAFQRWMPEASPGRLDPVAEFAQALSNAGLRLEQPPQMDGTLHRVPVNGDRPGARSGAYVGFLDGHPAGYLQNFKTGLETTWKSSQPAACLSDLDRERLSAEATQRQHARAEAQAKRAQLAAQQAAERLAQAKPCQTHPYLVHKGVKAWGLFEDAEGHLLLPIRDVDGTLWSLQTIAPDGQKGFLKDGKLHGGMLVLGNLSAADTVLLAEGYATGATLHAASGLPVVVAFHAGNLSSVAEALRHHAPKVTVIVAADNDHQRHPNPGLQKAQEAADRVGGVVWAPTFSPGDPGSDWNDWAQHHGAEALNDQLQPVLDQARLTQQVYAHTQLEPQPALVSVQAKDPPRVRSR